MWRDGSIVNFINTQDMDSLQHTWSNTVLDLGGFAGGNRTYRIKRQLFVQKLSYFPLSASKVINSMLTSVKNLLLKAV